MESIHKMTTLRRSGTVAWLVHQLKVLAMVASVIAITMVFSRDHSRRGALDTSTLLQQHHYIDSQLSKLSRDYDQGENRGEGDGDSQKTPQEANEWEIETDSPKETSPEKVLIDPERKESKSAEQIMEEVSPWIFRPQDFVYKDNLDKKKMVTMMFWSSYPESGVTPDHQQISRDMRDCPNPRCTFIQNITKADVLIFDGLVLAQFPMKKFPPRPKNQVWFLSSSDPVTNDHGLDDDRVRSEFNLLSTIKTDSDIPYLGYLQKASSPSKDVDFSGIYRKKTKLAAWFVSNCDTPSQREAYAWRMSKLGLIDIYGGCGRLKCGHNHRRMEFDVPQCFPMLTDNYKFYLAFESHFCKDYVTEKFFKIYYPGTHVIPVVRGGVDYNRFLPKDTFVNAADFESPEDLMRYLIKLGNDEAAYVKMLKAKARWELSMNMRINTMCILCEYMHTHDVPPKIPDVYKAFTGNPDEECWAPSDFGSGPRPDQALYLLFNISKEERKRGAIKMKSLFHSEP